jgi:Xaa-Pro aminopeptidase
MPWKPPPRAGATVLIWAGYSLAERERRWKAVRESAAKAGFDCIFVPLGNGIDGRYLTQLRCSSMVLPTDEREPIIIADRSSKNEWVPEPWQTSREWAEPMSEALLDAGMERARIGVAGLKGGKVTHVSSPDGVVNHTGFSEVMRRLPKATFEDATDVVGFVRYVKSEEEISFLKQAVTIAEAGIDEMVKSARPGLDGALLYAAVTERMLELCTEYYPLTISVDSIGALKPTRYTNPPIGKRLESNMLITNEVNAISGAQLTQECQPIVLGRIPDEWKPVIELQKEVFEGGLGFMKPGTLFGDFIDFANRFGEKRGMKTSVFMHGCGYGDDGPSLSARSGGERVRDLRFEGGNAFVWKPMVMTPDERIRFVWGGSMLVTDRGGEVLFKRPHGMISITEGG